MRSIPDRILDIIQDDELKEEVYTLKDGESWLFSESGLDEHQEDKPEGQDDNAIPEPQQLYLNREQRIRQQFRAEFYSRSSRYAKWFFASLLIVAGIQYAVVGAVELVAFGVSTTILGSVILGLSLLRGPYSVIKETSSKIPTLSGENMDPETLEYVHTTIDGINGISYVVVGFILQFVSTLIM